MLGITGDDAVRIALLLVADIAVVAGLSVLLGATAPRWPRGWIARDRFPVRTWGWETPGHYRALGVPWLARSLPEFGAVFGGASKAALPGTGVQALTAYLAEVRRAEWVHWCSALTWLPLMAFNPWWLTTAMAVVVIGVNVPFILVLRHNRLRLARLLARAADNDRSRP